jgi:predicted GIY-YIG superfamily endonuclease
MWLYVLKLAHDKWYVGTTRGPVRHRVDAHQRGAGSSWTRKHRVLGVAEQTPVDPATAGFTEDAKVLAMMARFGIEAVRGGTYSAPALGTRATLELRRKLWHNSGACMRCGRRGHMAAGCWALTTVDGDPIGTRARCTRCVRASHTVAQCYARTTADGRAIADSDTESSGSESEGDAESGCAVA